MGQLTSFNFNEIEYVPETPVIVEPGDQVYTQDHKFILVFRLNKKKWYQFWIPKFIVIKHKLIRVIK